ncbi:MAG: molybdopterin-dependent oxidoreductase [Gammaproteobacteria bacterium]|nr:molybdopterin-dependent oxidoreductase [Gammaproteobacteria bacterium]
MKRRDFLKALGLGGTATLAGCDLPTTVTLEEGKEDVISYLLPEEYAIPGIAVWYASTCTQCTAGCGIHGRVREGRVLKIEGNPDAPINAGKTCQMGQAGLQGHYNPDRITTPMVREGGKLVPTTWEKAQALLNEKLGAKSSLNADRVAWFTGTLSGHQRALVVNHLDAVGSKQHFAHEIVNASVWQAVCRDMLDDPMPRIRLDKAKLILSFGADFLATWISPVHFAGQYSKFRTAADRGALIQVESKMSMTGGSADLWVAIRPGTEGALALGLANYLVANGVNASALSAEVRDKIAAHDLQKVASITGIASAQIERIGKALKGRNPSVVLAGASVEGQAQGYEAVAAIMLLNVLLGNIGTTIEPSGKFPFPQLEAKSGGTRDLLAFAQAVQQKQLDVVFFYGANPLYSAPVALKLDEQINNIPFKVALAQFPDETAMHADLVLPVSSYLEDWGTHVAAYQAEQNQISVQQPLMQKLYAETRGFGDVMVSLLAMRNAAQWGAFADSYGYMKNVFTNMKANVGAAALSNDEFWNNSLQTGMVKVDAPVRKHTLKPVVPNVAANSTDVAFPFYLVPSPRMGLFDGRHANLPWLQESPDQIAKVVWDSWAEMHPSTADKLGIAHGDVIKVESEHGALEVKAYLVKAIHPDAISIPLGQGHTEYGRYAKDRGVNPLKILKPITDAKTGELAMYATRVKVSKTGKQDVIIRLGHSDTQHGRRLVRTVSVDVLKRTKGA